MNLKALRSWRSPLSGAVCGLALQLLAVPLFLPLLALLPR